MYEVIQSVDSNEQNKTQLLLARIYITCPSPHFSAYKRQATPQSKEVNWCLVVIALVVTANQDRPSVSGQHVSSQRTIFLGTYLVLSCPFLFAGLPMGSNNCSSGKGLKIILNNVQWILPELQSMMIGRFPYFNFRPSMSVAPSKLLSALGFNASGKKSIDK